MLPSWGLKWGDRKNHRRIFCLHCLHSNGLPQVYAGRCHPLWYFYSLSWENFEWSISVHKAKREQLNSKKWKRQLRNAVENFAHEMKESSLSPFVRESDWNKSHYTLSLKRYYLLFIYFLFSLNSDVDIYLHVRRITSILLYNVTVHMTAFQSRYFGKENDDIYTDTKSCTIPFEPGTSGYSNHMYYVCDR